MRLETSLKNDLKNELQKNLSVLYSAKKGMQITKSFFRKNGHHLNRANAVKYFTQDIELVDKIKYENAIAVFGSARVNEKNYPRLTQKAFELGYLAAKNNFIIVNGGGPGIMEISAKGAIEGGTYSIGFQPRFIEEKEKPIKMDGKVHLRVNSLHTRKILMANNAKALVFFPGGAGTMDELFEYLNFLRNGFMKNVNFILIEKRFWSGLVSWIEKNLIRNGYEKPDILKNIYLVDNPKEALKIIQKTTNQNPISYTPKARRLINSFLNDIEKIYQYIENIGSPSASYFCTLNPAYKFKKIAQTIKQITKKLQKDKYTIYYSDVNGLAKLMDEYTIEAKQTKNLVNEKLSISLNLFETQKLVLGASDLLIFYPGNIQVIDALTDYIVRIQMGDMEQVPIKIIDKDFWAGYFDWFKRYPIDYYGFAENELLKIVQLLENNQIIIKT